MGVIRIELRDFRCFARVGLDAHPGVNFFCGPNGSGKTSVLEAVHVMGSGRSFRVKELRPLVRRGTEDFTVEATIEPRHVLRARGGTGGRVLTLNEQPVRGSAALAAELPVQALHPEMHALIEGPPEGRRRFLDWGVFHVKRPYLEAWRRYHRALRQRNAALKRPESGGDFRVWDSELVSAGEYVDAQRLEYAEALAGAFRAFAERLMPAAAELHYRRGWADEHTLAVALERFVERDRLLKTTQIGPHRADLHIRMDGLEARSLASRGQQKMLALCLGLAQGEVIGRAAERRMVLLVDDPVAEVDVTRAERLAGELSRIQAQRFITGLTREAYPGHVDRLFHVKQGELVQMI